MVRSVSLETSGRKRRRASSSASGASRQGRSRMSRGRSNVPRSLASTRRHCYTRTISTGSTPGSNDAISVNAQNAQGLSATGFYDMEFSFSLQKVQMYIAGTAFVSWTMPNYADFTNLYDKYRIDWVEVTLTFNGNTHTGGSVQSLPRVFFVEDNDDTNSINLASIQQYDNLKTFQFGTGDGVMKTFRIHPKPQELVYYTTTLSGYQQGSNKKFIDTTYPDVPQYGCKMIVDPIVYAASSTLLGSIALSFKYHITCDSTK